MMRFLIEAGLVYQLSQVRHGADRTYDRYVPHMLFLLEERAFSPGRGLHFKNTIKFIQRPNRKHPVRRTFKTLLSMEKLKSIADADAYINDFIDRLESDAA